LKASPLATQSVVTADATIHAEFQGSAYPEFTPPGILTSVFATEISLARKPYAINDKTRMRMDKR
jgi:hypothetical protein|tara:strand:+ start:78 stop:272 length:195 start_codon:yes stop_codon:yes gene_type:complete